MANKTQPTQTDPRDYIAALDDETQIDDCTYLIGRMQKMTGCAPQMWGPSIIGFGSYHYRYQSGREGDFFEVGFAPRKRQIVLYLTACDATELADLLAKLGPHKTGKSCVYIKRLADIDLKVLDEMIARAVKNIREKWPKA